MAIPTGCSRVVTPTFFQQITSQKILFFPPSNELESTSLVIFPILECFRPPVSSSRPVIFSLSSFFTSFHQDGTLLSPSLPLGVLSLLDSLSMSLSPYSLTRLVGLISPHVPFLVFHLGSFNGDTFPLLSSQCEPPVIPYNGVTSDQPRNRPFLPLLLFKASFLFFFFYAGGGALL